MTDSDDVSHDETEHTLDPDTRVDIPLDAFDVVLIKVALRQSDGLIRTDSDNPALSILGPGQEDEDEIIEDLIEHLEHFKEPDPPIEALFSDKK